MPFLEEEQRRQRSNEDAGKTNHRSPRGRGSDVETNHSSRQLRGLILELDSGLASPDLLTLHLLYLSHPGDYYLKDSRSVDKMSFNTWVVRGLNKIDESSSSLTLAL